MAEGIVLMKTVTRDDPPAFRDLNRNVRWAIPDSKTAGWGRPNLLKGAVVKIVKQYPLQDIWNHIAAFMLSLRV